MAHGVRGHTTSSAHVHMPPHVKGRRCAHAMGAGGRDMVRVTSALPGPGPARVAARRLPLDSPSPCHVIAGVGALHVRGGDDRVFLMLHWPQP